MCGIASYYNNVFKDMNIAAKPLAPPVAEGARDHTISICKGIAIILMVVGHVEAPELLTNFIYTFHMPLFFIAAGYFSVANGLTALGNFASGVSRVFMFRS